LHLIFLVQFTDFFVGGCKQGCQTEIAITPPLDWETDDSFVAVHFDKRSSGIKLI